MLSIMLSISPEEYQAKLKEAVRLKGISLFSSKTYLVEQLDLLIPNHRRENQLIMVAFEANVFRILRLTSVEKLEETYEKLYAMLQEQWGLNPEAASFCVDTLCLFLGYRITRLPAPPSPAFIPESPTFFPEPQDHYESRAIQEYEEEKQEQMQGWLKRQHSRKSARIRQAFLYLAPLLIGVNAFLYGLWYLKNKEEVQLVGQEAMEVQRMILAFKDKQSASDPIQDRNEDQLQKGKLKSLFRAISSQDLITLKNLVLETKLGPGATDSEGYSLLMEAARLDAVPILNFLIESGVNLNHQDKKGRTALMIAAQAGHLQSLRMLIEAGADWKIHDHKGRSALVLAIENYRSATVQFLSYIEKARRK